MIKVIQLRLVAETQADAIAAITALRDAIGSSRVALSSPHEGRKGGWLSYGTLQVEAPTAGECAVCHTSIVQERTGRPRKYCAACADQLGHQTLAAFSRESAAENATPTPATGPTTRLWRKVP
jgi:hypothetical protein